jgi:hypothetical protein
VAFLAMRKLISLPDKHQLCCYLVQECLGLHNKPTAEVHPGHKLTGLNEGEGGGGGGELQHRNCLNANLSQS